MRKKLLFTFLALTVVLQSWGQLPWDRYLNRPRNEERPVRFGIAIGLNTMDFRLTNTGIQAPVGSNGEMGTYFATVDRLKPGFNVNAMMRVRFTDYLHMRFLPGICFGERDISFYRNVPTDEHQTEAIKIQVESAYIEMPILLCYQAFRHSNARPYVVAGLNVRLDMAAFKKLKIEHNQLLRLNKFDLAYEVGVGYEFYFTYFKMAPEIKWSASVLNGLAKTYAEGAEAYHGSIKRLTSQVFVFSLIFE